MPVFAAARAQEGQVAADRMASQAMAFIMTVVALVTIGIEVAMPWIMPFLLSAYVDDPGTLATATLMAQLAMPYLVFMTLAALLSGVLNTLGRAPSSSAVALIFLTASSALSTVAINGRVTCRNSRPSNCVSRLCPIVSAVTPV